MSRNSAAVRSLRKLASQLTKKLGHGVVNTSKKNCHFWCLALQGLENYFPVSHTFCTTIGKPSLGVSSLSSFHFIALLRKTTHDMHNFMRNFHLSCCSHHTQYSHIFLCVHYLFAPATAGPRPPLWVFVNLVWSY
jgi:hypothetical protein